MPISADLRRWLVTVSIDAVEEIQNDAAYAACLGFAGKLLIHPRQVQPATLGFQPSAQEVAWARRVMSVSSAVGIVDGGRVDTPVRLRAAQLLRRRQ